MEDIIPCPVKDQEVFQRVWQRVMAGRSEAGSPIQPAPSGGGDVSCECLKALFRQDGDGLPPECVRPEEEPRPTRPAPEEDDAQSAPAPEQLPPEEAPVPEPPGQSGLSGQGLPPQNGSGWGGDMPSLWEEPQGGDDRAARLRRHVMDALEGWQFYRYLARRARGTDARALNSLAGELHRHARKLSAAYFLLTGLRYWPTELLGTPAIPSYWGALRSRHQAEQRQETAFRLAADDWEDPDMLELYGELADACQQRCRRLRALLEQGV